MITVHLHLPGSNDEQEYAVYALSDGEAISLPSRYCEPDAHESIHVANEIAFDAFRLAVAQDKILHTNIRWRCHGPNGVTKGVFSRFGVPLTADGSRHGEYRSPGNELVDQILMTAAQKSKHEKMEKIRVLEAQRAEPNVDNCKGNVDDENSNPSVG